MVWMELVVCSHQIEKIMYYILTSKRPWVLEIHWPKKGGGHLHRESIRMYNVNIHANHRIIKWDRHLHRNGHLLGRLGVGNISIIS